jgi:ankyrin repeat protein
MDSIYHYIYYILQWEDTPLMRAIANGYVQICELLLNRGAIIDYKKIVCDHIIV